MSDALETFSEQLSRCSWKLEGGELGLGDDPIGCTLRDGHQPLHRWPHHAPDRLIVKSPSKHVRRD